MFENLEQLDELLTEVAELGDFAELTRAAQDQPTWWLAVNERQSVIVEWNEPSRRMMFSAEIGALPERDRESALKQALYFNLAWQQTGGARMALMPEDDSLQLMLDLHAEHLSNSQVVTVISNLLQAAEDWKTGWETPSEESAAPSSTAAPEGNQPPPGSIRV